MKKYVCYYRVSTEKQGDSGLGLESQSQDTINYTKNGAVVGSFTEIESGRKADRKELANAIELAKKEGATLVIAKLDRLTRDSLFLNQLLASELSFICCDNPEATPMVLRILAAVAQDEVEKTRKRTKASLDVIKSTIKEQGYYVSKSGNVITRLGNRLRFNSEEEKAQHYRKIASNRVYQKKSPLAKVLVKSLSENGKTPDEIMQQLKDLGEEISLRTFYNYKK